MELKNYPKVKEIVEKITILQAKVSEIKNGTTVIIKYKSQIITFIEYNPEYLFDPEFDEIEEDEDVDEIYANETERLMGSLLGRQTNIFVTESVKILEDEIERLTNELTKL